MKLPLSPLPLSVACLFVAGGSQAVEVDVSFEPNLPSGTVHSISVNGESGVFIGGEFAAGQSSVLKLDENGVIDDGFAAALRGRTFSVGIDGNGRIFAVGSYGVNWLKPDGTLWDGTAALPTDGWVKCAAVAPDGTVVIGGSFYSQPGRFVARVGVNGVDAGFSSALQRTESMEAGVEAVAIQHDGKIIVGGNFRVAGQFATLARLNADGSVDSTFNRNHGATLYPRTILVLPDGKLLVGGVADASGRGFVRRLEQGGAIDPTFGEAVFDRGVEALAVDGEGRIVVGGDFGQANGAAQARLARLTADGSLDTSWAMGANNVVTTVVVDPSGRVLVGGAFSEVGDVPRKGAARLVENDGFRFRSLAVTAGGEMHLSLQGEAGRTYVIESSNDLNSWSVFKTNQATAEGLSISASVGESPRQFFRARLAE